MIQDSATHRVFKIDELVGLIASQLVLISLQSTVNLARTCRHLEEPALSALWVTQSSLYVLLEVLPEEDWNYSDRKEVRGLNLLLGKSDAEVSGNLSS